MPAARRSGSPPKNLTHSHDILSGKDSSLVLVYFAVQNRGSEGRKDKKRDLEQKQNNLILFWNVFETWSD